VESSTPKEVSIAPNIFKRIVNNLISYSLNNTSDSVVNVNICYHNIDFNCLNNGDKLFRVGAESLTNQEYLVVRISFKGKDIPENQLKDVFVDQNTDQEAENREGIGMGLAICLKMAMLIQAFIQ